MLAVQMNQNILLNVTENYLYLPKYRLHGSTGSITIKYTLTQYHADYGSIEKSFSVRMSNTNL